MKSLSTRLSAVFLIILLLLGSLIFWLANRSAQRYFLEFTQELNSPIAMYMAQNANLAITDGLNIDALAELTPHVMMINPSVEVYLLDTAGNVVGHTLEAEELKLDQVSLEPIHEFMTDDKVFPLFGDNPKNADKQHIFSVSPLTDGTTTTGYVYAVLAGENHQTLMSAIAGSHSIKTLAITLSCIFLFALLTGCIIFFMLTHRLRALTRSVQKWKSNHSNTNSISANQSHKITDLDEIDELNHAYESMAKSLLEQFQALEKNDQTRRELFANISHDLRTPLTTLQGYLETIILKRKQLTEEEQHKYLKVAHSQSKRLRKLVTQLFELSKLNSGEFEIIPEVFSLRELAHDSVQVFEIQARQKSIDMQVVHDGLGRHGFDVNADIALIHRVFENLLDNAIRFTPTNGKIVISLKRRASDRISVSINDTGTGMSLDDARHVFERHYSPASSPDRDAGHAGLGLAIVQSILELHECDIRVSSKPGQGTTFRFELPGTTIKQPVQTLQIA